MDSSAINWNNTLEYIKMQLGAQVNRLEINEYDMINIIKTVTMPEFCQYVNYIDRISYPSDKIVKIDSEYRYRYKIINYERQIYEIKQIYLPVGIVNMLGTTIGNPVAQSIKGYTASMNTSLMPVRTFQFFRPDVIELDIPLGFPEPTHFDVEVGAEFLNPNEIEPSMYSAFKKLAAADVIDYIISIRSKFEQLTTPQGTINLNISRLEQKAERLRAEAMQKLENTVPDVYWSWINP